MTLQERLKSLGAKVPTSSTPRTLWQGPEEDGITFSLLSRFLVCRERFRILVVEGLTPIPSFQHRLEYGSMWHVCEEAHSSGKGWKPDLAAYCRKLCEKYPTQQEQVAHWYNVCCVQFPVYLSHWHSAKVRSSVPKRTLCSEQVFNIPYLLPSGRVVRLKGKMDSVDLVGAGTTAGIWLQDNKTKGDINEGKIKRQLAFDLQTMIYLVALEKMQELRLPPFSKSPLATVRGVCYNVVRRPLSGGKGSIVRHKPTKSNPRGESAESFYGRLQGIIREDPGYYFMRWQCEVTRQDIDKFRKECLDPILEQLCDWWEWVTQEGDERNLFGSRRGIHWRHPFGVYNVLDEGGSSELDEYLASGSTAGLARAEGLFPELE